MKLIGLQVWPIARLKLPGDWKKTMQDPNLQTMAWSRKLVGQLQEPMARKSDHSLIFGRRRVASALVNGETEILLKVVECDDREARLMARIENAHREHMSRDDLKKWIDEMATDIAALEAAGEGSIAVIKHNKSHVKTPARLAREIAADALGVSHDAVKKGLSREKKRKAAIKEKVGHDMDLGIRSPWATLDDEFRKQTNAIVAATNQTAQLLQKAQQNITLMESQHLPLHGTRMNKVREAIGHAAAALRGLVPTSLCLACKGVTELQRKCTSCEMTGYITRNQEDAFPKELWDEENPVVLAQGKFAPLSMYSEAEPENDASYGFSAA